MNKTQKLQVLAASMLLLAPLLAPAQETDGTAAPAPAPVSGPAPYGGIGINLGSTGLGIDYRYGFNRFLALRGGYQFGSYSHDWDQDGNTYTGKLKANAAKLMLDVMPFGGGFRLSAGLYTKVPEFTLKARGLQQYDYNDTPYNGDLKVDGGIDLGKAAPYLGLGWGGTPNGRGFGVGFDMGVLIGKSPDVRLSATGRACDASVDSACDPNGVSGFDVSSSDPRALVFQQDLKDEIARIEDDAKSFRFWPVLNLALVYRF
ncbi:hypothetical protein SAMN04488038_11486 [Solimonas aquatica]|uniref:Outer membrane protein beta-barrel domain-containing protein n=1 Tax=Solimonas aquatica TaxID=489703 RepID=A0A1H9KXE9_9GAMM|nr:hypothetical protein [Solimonas aquatica]SER03901.1 hypothetical protein SAMN04488038_11486 [Solimonas aquatica]